MFPIKIEYFFLDLRGMVVVEMVVGMVVEEEEGVLGKTFCLSSSTKKLLLALFMMPTAFCVMLRVWEYLFWYNSLSKESLNPFGFLRKRSSKHSVILRSIWLFAEWASFFYY